MSDPMTDTDNYIVETALTETVENNSVEDKKRLIAKIISDTKKACKQEVARRNSEGDGRIMICSEDEHCVLEAIDEAEITV